MTCTYSVEHTGNFRVCQSSWSPRRGVVGDSQGNQLPPSPHDPQIFLEVCLNCCCDQGASDSRVDWLDIDSWEASLTNWPIILSVKTEPRSQRPKHTVAPRKRASISLHNSLEVRFLLLPNATGTCPPARWSVASFQGRLSHQHTCTPSY